MELLELFRNFVDQMGITSWFQSSFEWQSIVMIALACLLIYLAVAKGFEPYLLIPIAFGMLLVNLPLNGLMESPLGTQKGGLLYYIHEGVSLGLFPPLIFLGIGATTDFGPLIANPKSLVLGAAAQIGIFMTFLGALLLGFSGAEAASIGIIGGADGPTAIFLSNTLLGGTTEGSAMCAIIAVVAYSYMALVPIIQPPIIKLLTTKEERLIKMDSNIRTVSKKEKIIFPIVVSIVVILLVPSCAALVGMLMLGNLIKESGVVPNLVDAAGKTLMYAITILLGISVGSTAVGTSFLQLESLYILALGLVAFSCSTAGGVLIGKLMCKLTKGKINPMIGAAGVSAVPMAARVVHKIGLEEDNTNYLLMHAMGPNVAGVIGSAVAAGLLLSIFA